MNINEFMNLSLDEKRELILSDLLDCIFLNDVINQEIDIQSLILIIKNKGHLLDNQSISKIIDLENYDVLMELSLNYNIKLSVFHIRDIIRCLNDDSIISKHPSYKDFWIGTFVQKEEDFLEHTQNHINNVNILAQKIIEYIVDNEDLREYFNVPSKIKNKDLIDFVAEGMLLHDKAKVCDDEDFLAKNHLDEAMYKTLYSHYGKGMNDDLKLVVNKLNEIDNNIINDYLDSSDKWLRDLFFKVEKMADCVERGCNQITTEEMKQDKIKPSVYLENILHPVELEIVKKFEKMYSTYCDKTL